MLAASKAEARFPRVAWVDFGEFFGGIGSAAGRRDEVLKQVLSSLLIEKTDAMVRVNEEISALCKEKSLQSEVRTFS